VKGAVDRWLTAAPVTSGRVFRAVSRHGTPWGTGISENVVWYVVRNCAQRLELDHFAPHDLRRTCAKLCHVNGGELEQIQFLLGHASVLTTGALPRLQTESGRTGERPVRLPVLEESGFAIRSVHTSREFIALTMNKHKSRIPSNLIDNGVKRWSRLERPLAGLAPASFHFRDAEVAVAIGAEEFGPIPFEEVVRGTAYAGRRGERAKALLAACLLVEE